MKHIIRNSLQLGITVKSLRNEQNLSQNDVYNKVGLLQKTISSIESVNGGTTIELIYNFLNV